METSVCVGEIKKNYLYLFIKRFFDILLALVGCAILLILVIVIKVVSLANKDFDSIFYSQNRIGKNGKTFKLYKFRSMVPNADELLKKILKEDKKLRKEWEDNQKFDKDPRITKIGNILRKTSLDEIPQFINVLKGDMSLIGPRPLVPGELEAHNGNKDIYEIVKPGLTGWWGCNGRSNLTYEERLELEYYYCINASLKLDIKCFFLTIKTILFDKDAK
ncbi:MAG: sugar transferase [bacterium]